MSCLRVLSLADDLADSCSTGRARTIQEAQVTRPVTGISNNGSRRLRCLWLDVDSYGDARRAWGDHIATAGIRANLTAFQADPEHYREPAPTGPSGIPRIGRPYSLLVRNVKWWRCCADGATMPRPDVTDGLVPAITVCEQNTEVVAEATDGGG